MIMIELIKFINEQNYVYKLIHKITDEYNIINVFLPIEQNIANDIQKQFNNLIFDVNTPEFIIKENGTIYKPLIDVYEPETKFITLLIKK